MKAFDAHSPNLYLACATGDHFTTARLLAFLGDSTTPFMEILMQNVFVESVQDSGSQGNLPSESVSFTSERLFLNGSEISQDPVARISLNQRIAMLIEKATKPAVKATVTVH
jgi:hypothetical protein